MNWPAYPEYKASGVDWLGDVPAGWTMDRLKHAFSRVNRSYSVNAETVTVFRDGEVTRRSNRRTDGFTEADKYIGYQGINPGDLAIHAMDGFAGAIGVSDSAGKCSPVVSVCSAKADADPYFYAHILRHIARSGYLTAIAKGVRERSTDFRWADAQGLLVPFPPASEQQRIADFLERETAKIDALIDKQNQLIATLREDRTATITHAVTKGLNPDAEMKDSQVLVLPPLPAHWEVRAVKHLGQLVTGSTPPTDELANYTEGTEGFPWYRPEDLDTSGRPSVASRLLTVSGRATVPYLKSPAVFVVSIGATLGKIGYSEVDGSSNQQITAIVGSSNAKFVYYALSASHSQIWASSMGNTIPIISAGRLGAVRLPVPPADEQNQIAAFLDDQCAVIDALIKKSTEVIAMLLEYRSALITAAVTGKIDVREAA